MRKDLSTLSVQQMRTFCGVYQSGGYAGAEESLGLTGPTMFEQIKAIESVYGTKLFTRLGRRIEPTEAGDTLYRLMVPLLANIESTVEVVAELADVSPKTISIVTGARMMLEELGRPLAEFRKQHPNVRLRLVTADNRAAQEHVLQGKADLALLIEPPKGLMADGLCYEKLYPIDYLAAFPSRHRLIRKAAPTLEEILSEPLILGTPNTIARQMIEHAYFRLGIKTPLNIVAETDNSATTIACVRSGLGVGIIAGRADGILTRQLATRSLTGEIGKVEVVAAYRAGRQLTRVLRAFLLQILRDIKTEDESLGVE